MKTNRFFATLVGIIILSWSTFGFSATITVNTFADELNGGGNCSLREAVESANSNADVGGCVAAGAYGDDTIILAAGVYSLTIPSTGEQQNINGDLNIGANLGFSSSTITIRGDMTGMTTIDASGIADRALYVHANTIVNLYHLTISGGNAVEFGAGIYNSGGDLYIYNSTLTNNTAADLGSSGAAGAIYTVNNAIPPKTTGGDLFIYNSTISGNAAAGADGIGGGIYVDDTQAYLYNCTITGNTAVFGGGVAVIRGSIGPTTELNAFNSIIAGNTLSTSEVYLVGPGGIAVFNSDHCVLGTNASNGVELDAGGQHNSSNDIIPTGAITTVLDPLLAANGGPTQTHALVIGSPAIDQASATALPADQRGWPRVGAADIGAFEFGAVDPVALVSPAIPTVGGWGLINLSLLLLIAGAFVLRRRQEVS